MQYDLSEQAADRSLAALIVKARLLEAADTVAHMDVGRLRPGKERTAWPHFLDETIGGHSVGYGHNESRFRYRPSAEAISRAEEVNFVWLPKLIAHDEYRLILGRWALSVACPRIGGSFRAWCRKTNRSRSTADRVVKDGIQAITTCLLKNAQSLHEPHWSRVVPMMPECSRSFPMLAIGAHGAGIRWSREPDARPSINGSEPQQAA